MANDNTPDDYDDFAALCERNNEIDEREATAPHQSGDDGQLHDLHGV